MSVRRVIAGVVLLIGLTGCSEAAPSRGAGDAAGASAGASASSRASNAGSPSGTKAPPTPKPVARAAGTGFADSKTFKLTAGDYLVRWTITSAEAAGCVALGAIHTKDGRTSVEIANTRLGSAGVQNGKQSVPKLKAGTYLITFATTCSWSASVFAD